MRRNTRMQQHTPNSLNQSMTNGLPNLSPEQMNLCVSQFNRRRMTSRQYESPRVDELKLHLQTQFIKDYEQLQEEILALKRENQKLKHLNQQLTFQIKLDEREQTLHQNVTSDSSECNSSQHHKLIEKLKHARLIIADLKVENENLRRTGRYAKLQEYDSEIAKLKAQNELLSKQVSELGKNDNDQPRVNKLTHLILDLEERLRHYSISQQKLKRKLQLLRQELALSQSSNEKYKKQLQEKSDEYDSYRKKNESELQSKTKQKEQIQHLTEVICDKNNRIQELIGENEKQKHVIQQKLNQLREIEEQYQAKKSFQFNKREVDVAQQQALDKRISKVKRKYSDESNPSEGSQTKRHAEQQQNKNSQQGSRQPPLNLVQYAPKKSFDEMHYRPEQSPKNKSIESPAHSSKLIEERKDEKKKPKLPRVNHFDVEEIGKSLRLKFMANNIKYEMMDSFIPSSDLVSIQELIWLFGESPFEIGDPQQRLLMARYMVEENSQAVVEFDERMMNDVAIVRSVLKNLVGRYQLFTEAEELSLRESIRQSIGKFKQSLYEQLKQIQAKRPRLKPEHCEFDDLKNALAFCNLSLESREKEYIGLFIFKATGGESQFDYRTILDTLLAN